MKYIGIALSGKQRSGKDTLAANLNAADQRFVRVGIADQVKHEANMLFGGDLDFFDEEVKLAHRDVLIAVGKAGRAIDPDYWLNQAVSEAKDYADPDVAINMAGDPGPGIPVITDCRFKNEADRLKAEGFLLVRLDASEFEQEARGVDMSSPSRSDPTETDLDDYDGFDAWILTDLKSPREVMLDMMSIIDINGIATLDLAEVDA